MEAKQIIAIVIAIVVIGLTVLRFCTYEETGSQLINTESNGSDASGFSDNTSTLSGNNNSSNGNSSQRTSTGPCLIQQPDKYIDPNGECRIRVDGVIEVYTDGVPVDFYQEGSSVPMPYSGKGRIDTKGANIHIGLWRVTGPPGTLIRVFQPCR